MPVSGAKDEKVTLIPAVRARTGTSSASTSAPSPVVPWWSACMTDRSLRPSSTSTRTPSSSASHPAPGTHYPLTGRCSTPRTGARYCVPSFPPRSPSPASIPPASSASPPSSPPARFCRCSPTAPRSPRPPSGPLTRTPGQALEAPRGRRPALWVRRLRPPPLEHPLAPLGSRVGSLTIRAAQWTGLPADIAVGAGNAGLLPLRGGSECRRHIFARWLRLPAHCLAETVGEDLHELLSRKAAAQPAGGHGWRSTG